jgi:ATP-dependent RNA helicase DeaD
MTRQPTDPDGFPALGLDSVLLSSLSSLGYEEPTPIQRETIPPLLAGRDVLGLAATGTGKTAAFALPMLQRLSAEKARGVRGLVLVPTRELAMQVAEALHRYGRGLKVSVLPVYGGQWIGQQLKALARGVDVVVATPGRALDLLQRGSLSLDQVRTLVLDEADEMLDLGFADDIEALIDATPAHRQTALFSATMPPRIRDLAARRMRDPVSVTVAPERTARGALPRVRQVAYVLPRAHKPSALGRILDLEAPAAALVFCRTREAVDELAESLEAHGYRVAALHGGMVQKQRDRVLQRFREGGLDLLVATDVAARGLDIPHISHVINYDLPNSAEGYVHRIGRTGRAGREGVAITLAQPREERLLREIERFTRQKIELAVVPTVADLRARRLELTRASLREAVAAGGLDGFRAVVESVAEEFDLLDVAAAALKLLHESDERRPEVAAAEAPPRRAPAPETPSRPRERPEPGPPLAEGDMVRVFVGAGRTAGIRPADLVGALVKGAGLDPRALGAIHIGDRFSLFEVRSDRAQAAIAGLGRTPLRGREVVVRRDDREVPGPRKGRPGRAAPARAGRSRRD